MSNIGDKKPKGTKFWPRGFRLGGHGAKKKTDVVSSPTTIETPDAFEESPREQLRACVAGPETFYVAESDSMDVESLIDLLAAEQASDEAQKTSPVDAILAELELEVGPIVPQAESPEDILAFLEGDAEAPTVQGVGDILDSLFDDEPGHYVESGDDILTFLADNEEDEASISHNLSPSAILNELHVDERLEHAGRTNHQEQTADQILESLTSGALVDAWTQGGELDSEMAVAEHDQSEFMKFERRFNDFRIYYDQEANRAAADNYYS